VLTFHRAISGSASIPSVVLISLFFCSFLPH
jgi:hypothetical protein